MEKMKNLGFPYKYFQLLPFTLQALENFSPPYKGPWNTFACFMSPMIIQDTLRSPYQINYVIKNQLVLFTYGKVELIL